MPYDYRKTEHGDIESCDCCQWEAPVSFFNGGPGLGDDKWLCEVCSSTTISRIANDRPNSPAEYQHQLTAKTMAEVANLLLDKLTDRKP